MVLFRVCDGSYSRPGGDNHVAYDKEDCGCSSLYQGIVLGRWDAAGVYFGSSGSLCSGINEVLMVFGGKLNTYIFLYFCNTKNSVV